MFIEDIPFNACRFQDRPLPARLRYPQAGREGLLSSLYNLTEVAVVCRLFENSPRYGLDPRMLWERIARQLQGGGIPVFLPQEEGRRPLPPELTVCAATYDGEINADELYPYTARLQLASWKMEAMGLAPGHELATRCRQDLQWMVEYFLCDHGRHNP